MFSIHIIKEHERHHIRGHFSACWKREDSTTDKNPFIVQQDHWGFPLRLYILVPPVVAVKRRHFAQHDRAMSMGAREILPRELFD